MSNFSFLTGFNDCKMEIVSFLENIEPNISQNLLASLDSYLAKIQKPTKSPGRREGRRRSENGSRRSGDGSRMSGDGSCDLHKVDDHIARREKERRRIKARGKSQDRRNRVSPYETVQKDLVKENQIPKQPNVYISSPKFLSSHPHSLPHFLDDTSDPRLYQIEEKISKAEEEKEFDSFLEGSEDCNEFAETFEESMEANQKATSFRSTETRCDYKCSKKSFIAEKELTAPKEFDLMGGNLRNEIMILENYPTQNHSNFAEISSDQDSRRENGGDPEGISTLKNREDHSNHVLTNVSSNSHVPIQESKENNFPVNRLSDDKPHETSWFEQRSKNENSMSKTQERHFTKRILAVTNQPTETVQDNKSHRTSLLEHNSRNENSKNKIQENGFTKRVSATTNQPPETVPEEVKANARSLMQIASNDPRVMRVILELFELMDEEDEGDDEVDDDNVDDDDDDDDGIYME